MTYMEILSNMELDPAYSVMFGEVLCVPFDSLCRNAGGKPALPDDSKASPSLGYDFASGKWGDMIEMGIIDPAKVVKAAIRNSFSAAATLAACDHVIAMEQPR